jgi:hypothetical protein
MSDDARAPAVVADGFPGTPALVMSAGVALSRETTQEVAGVIERTCRRERMRRRTMTVTMAVVGALTAWFMFSVAPPGEWLSAALFSVGIMLGLSLPVFLAWGVFNRALLDATAAHAAVPRAVLADAVVRMRREGIGASTALREALAATTAAPAGARTKALSRR